MSPLKSKAILVYNFIIPSLLLNCVAIVILELVKSYGVAIHTAGWMEAFKDGSIVLGSFFLALYVPRMGYKRSLYIGVTLEIIASLLMALAPSKFTAPIFFVLVGVAFALIKVSTYSFVKVITKNENEHASFISFLEGFFITGQLLTFWLFSIFMAKGSQWTNAYWLLALLSAIGFFLLLYADLDEAPLQVENEKTKPSTSYTYKRMFRLLKQNVVILFVILAFAYVFIEQGITTWLPTYERFIFNIGSQKSVQFASLLAGSIAVGRLFGGVIMRYVSWRKLLMINLVIAMGLLAYSIHLTVNLPATTHTIVTWGEFPFAAYLIPLLGFFIGPIYPTLCSSILSSQPYRHQSAITGLIIIFSALGGTIGSRVMATFFENFGGLTAIKVPFIPMLVLLLLFTPYYRLLGRAKEDKVNENNPLVVDEDEALSDA